LFSISYESTSHRLIFFDCFSKRAHLRRPGGANPLDPSADQGSVDRQDHGRESCVSRHAIAEDRKGWLFRTARGHKADTLSDRAMSQSDAWCMIRRRAKSAGIAAEIGCHTFRATGITAYLANGGALEHAQEMAAHESPRTTKLYDRTKERLTQDEVERIRL
jgi:integrase/recombinase XerD